VADFALDPRIEASSRLVAELGLCQVRLQDDARFPWLVLIPRRAGAVELFDLSREDQITLLAEGELASHAVRALGEAEGRAVEKLNIANLGNVVAQLHVHVIGRRSDDPHWPGPVWGQGGTLAHDEKAWSARLNIVRAVLRMGLLS
jgi:diadenosine tetraphosphate (Ap4A) HIT family hydrolase